MGRCLKRNHSQLRAERELCMCAAFSCRVGMSCITNLCCTTWLYSSDVLRTRRTLHVLMHRFSATYSLYFSFWHECRDQIRKHTRIARGVVLDDHGRELWLDGLPRGICIPVKVSSRQKKNSGKSVFQKYR
jgi:hypothetical protein